MSPIWRRHKSLWTSSNWLKIYRKYNNQLYYKSWIYSKRQHSFEMRRFQYTKYTNRINVTTITYKMNSQFAIRIHWNSCYLFAEWKTENEKLFRSKGNFQSQTHTHITYINTPHKHIHNNPQSCGSPLNVKWQQHRRG